MASSSRKVAASLAAGAIVIGGGAVKLASRGADDIGRSADNVGQALDNAGPGVPHTRVSPPGGAEVGPVVHEGAAVVDDSSGAQRVVHQVLCEEFTALADPQSPGVITREELLGSVTSIVGERFSGVDPLFVQGVADQLLVAQGLQGELGGAAPQAYLRACPPL